jgi:hypothetical protein
MTVQKPRYLAHLSPGRPLASTSLSIVFGGAHGPDFVPLVVDGGSGAAAIEIEIGGAIVRVRAGVELGLLGKVVRLLKAMKIPALPGTPPSGVRVLIATRPVDLRRSADGLAATSIPNRCQFAMATEPAELTRGQLKIRRTK